MQFSKELFFFSHRYLTKAETVNIPATGGLAEVNFTMKSAASRQPVSELDVLPAPVVAETTTTTRKPETIITTTRGLPSAIKILAPNADQLEELLKKKAAASPDRLCLYRCPF